MDGPSNGPKSALLDTLLLDPGYQALKVISWRKAFCMGLAGKVELLSAHVRPIRTVSREFPLPAVVRLLSGYYPQQYVLRFSRSAVHQRDGYTCQYCGIRPRRDQITLDHVIPRHRGGPTSWTNVVTACRKCNGIKGGRLLHEAGLKLNKVPIRPRWRALTLAKFGGNIPSIWQPWLH